MKKKIACLFFAMFVSLVTIQAQNWNEIIKAVATDRAASDNFSHSVAISGDYAIVGAWDEDEDVSGANTLSNAGSAYILYNNNGTWEEVQKIVASDRAADDRFGGSVAISGDYAIVGVQFEDEDASGANTQSNAGSAYIFYNNAGTWEQVQKIVASDRFGSDYFGISVGISGDYAIVGASTEDHDPSGANPLNNAGSAYIFYNNAGTWEQVQKIVALDRNADDFFAISVAISGDYAILGAYLEDEDESGGAYSFDAGSAYIFHNNGSSWVQDQKIVASDRETNDQFGEHVAISGDYAIIGVHREDHDVSEGNFLANSGSAYIFYNNAGIWEEDQKIVASQRAANDYFGFSVAISGDYAIVGAYQEDQNALEGATLSNAGSAYIFYNNAGTWVQDQKAVASDRAIDDNFGYSVSISGDYTIVGAQMEDEDASGSTTLTDAGSVYIFTGLPIITSQPGDRSNICVNSSTTFSVSGNYITGYQWQLSTDGGSNFADIADGGAYSNTQTATLSVTVASAMDNYQYQCAVSNTQGTVNSDAATLTLEIEDPVITSTHNNQTVNANASCQASLPDYTGAVTATDNCGAGSLVVTQFPTASTTISGATNTVTLRVTDGAGNFAEASFNVEVVDITNPAITSTHNDQTINANTSCQALLPDYTGAVTATDNCGAGSLTVTQSPTAGTTISGATNQVTLTVTDDAGNDVAVSFNVEVVDVTDPAISSTHNDQTIDADIDCEAALPDYTGAVTATDNCGAGNLDVTQSPTAGTTVSGATNLVTLTVTDDAGNDVEVSFNVEVVDNADPVITSTHNDQTVNGDANCEAILLDYTGDVIATDNCDATLDFTQSPVAGGTITGITNQVTLTATDDAGNFVEVSFNVEVVDVTDPVITSTHNDQSMDADANCEAVLADYTGDVTATDNCDASLDITQSPLVGATVSGATNLVTLTATDDAGNFVEVSFNVAVVDNANPVITSTHNDEVISAVTNCDGVLPDYTGNVIANDNCDASLDVTQLPLAGTTISGTTNQLTLTVTDDNGNFETVIFNVAVEDNTDPVISSTHNDQIVDAEANCEVGLPDFTGDIDATDNCDVSLDVTQSPVAGTTVSGPTNLVTLTVTDDAGNNVSVSFNVEVVDNSNPVVTSTHNDQTINADANCEAVLPDFTGDIVAADNCDATLDVTQLPIAGTTASGVTNLITLTVTDDVGNFVEVSFNIEVVDVTDPVITSTHNDQSVDADVNCEASLPDYTVNVTATDNCDASLEVTQSPLAGATITGATNLVTLTVTDDAGNNVDVSFNVEVIDNTDPTITCLENQTVFHKLGETFYTVSGTEFNPVSSDDNCGVASVTNDFNDLETLEAEQFPIGTTTVTWTVTDEAGNSAICSFDVIVTETVGISDIAKSGILIYPNPTNGILKLEFKQKKIKNIRISDLNGSIKIEKTEIQPNETINLSQLENGVYIISIQTDNGIFTTKIVKEN